MENKPIATRPLTPAEQFLHERFMEERVQQTARLDELAKQLLTLELAIPGLYAAVLKLVQGTAATLVHGPLLWATFLLWFVALAASLTCLFPFAYRVNPDLLWSELETPGQEEGISVAAFYRHSARHKRWALTVGSIAFFGGIFCAGVSAL